MCRDREGRVVAPRVELANIGVEVSRLGFGTSALMSRVNRRDSLCLLDAALEQGITHFDTARSYGFGEAESVLGEFIASRREQLTITTKVGILPPRRSRWLSAPKAAARALISVLPSARRYVRQGAVQLLPEPRFDTAAMTESLETSLRALRTSYVDFLLLHEPRIEVLRSQEPFDFLQRMQSHGKVRLFGVATDLPGVLSELPEPGEILQHPYSIFSHTLNRAEFSSRGAVFAHSCLGAVLAGLRSELQSNKSMACDWCRILDLDLTAPGKLEQLTLMAAINDLPQAAILFTSTKVRHINENAATFGAAASFDQVEHFRRMVRDRIGAS